MSGRSKPQLWKYYHDDMMKTMLMVTYDICDMWCELTSWWHSMTAVNTISSHCVTLMTSYHSHCAPIHTTKYKSYHTGDQFHSHMSAPWSRRDIWLYYYCYGYHHWLQIFVWPLSWEIWPICHPDNCYVVFYDSIDTNTILTEEGTYQNFL